MKNKSRNIKIAILLVMSQNILYGFGDPISKAAYETISVYSLLTVRYTIAFIFMLIIAGRPMASDLKTCRPKDWLVPSICIGGAYLLGNIALELTAATSVAFLRSLSTILTPVLAFAIYRIKYDKRHIPFQLLIILGLYLLCGHGGLGSFGIGEILSLINAVLLACSLIYGEKAMTCMNALSLTCIQSGMSALMAFICALVFEHGINLSGADLKIWLIIVYLAILCTVSGYFLQNKAMEFISSSHVAVWQCLCPVMTALCSFFILGEAMSGAGIAGALILLFCTAGDTLLQKKI